MDKHPTTTIQVGSTNIAARKLSKPVRRHLQKNGVAAKRILHEFKVTPEAVIPVGLYTFHCTAFFMVLRNTHSCNSFCPRTVCRYSWQNVTSTWMLTSLTARRKGKGFMGVMKRWGFRGQPASHGASLSHRSAGSTGVTVSQHSLRYCLGLQGVGRTWKGTKMAGRSKSKYSTQQRLLVHSSTE